MLLLPSIDHESRTVTAAGIEITRTQAFSGMPELAAVLLLAAGVSLIGSVQAAITMRKHATTPNELEEWHPNYFRESTDAGEDDDQFRADGAPKAQGSFWMTAGGWEHRQVGTRWYGAQVRERLYTELVKANRWAHWTRRLYHVGVVALLAGLTALVWPPGGEWNLWRSVLVGLAGAATAAECIWIRLARAPRDTSPEQLQTSPEDQPSSSFC